MGGTTTHPPDAAIPMTPDDIHYYEPRAGHRLPHDPFNAIVGPRPIGWVSSLGADGAPNLAPYSFFNAFNYTPPIVGFASIGYKDSVRNIEHSREFVWNLATRPLAEAMNQTSASVGPQVSEFSLAGLTPMQGTLVGAPRVAESPVSFECRVTQVVQLQGADGAQVQTWLVLGEVVAVRLRYRVSRAHSAWWWPCRLFLHRAGTVVQDASPRLNA
jgi:flavin reductase (DIM6/NTAB) family NADH-FMN oxidoreductase RutF